jgi:glucan 1,3-beta-glucosidase
MEALQIDTETDTEHTFILDLQVDSSKEKSRTKGDVGLALFNYRAPPTLAWLYFALFFVLVCVYRAPQDPWSRVSVLIENSPTFYIKSTTSNKYYWVNGTSIHMTEECPRIKSSSFHLTTQGSCFRISTFNGVWVILNGSELALSSIETQATLFQVSSTEFNRDSAFVSALKVCGKDLWVSDRNHEGQPASTTQLPSTFEFFRPVPVRGVNLGGWFIPEVWMNPSFFNDTGTGWGGSLCAVVNFSRALAEARMAEHLETWVSESDFQKLAGAGFNSVRLPLGYWNVIDDPYHRYAPANVTTSLHYIDWVFEMTEKYNMSVLIDLHGAPGSQNGMDHSGCGYSMLGTPQWTSSYNINLTLQTIDAIAARYGGHHNLFGIELLNEPAEFIEAMDHVMLLHFYQSAYEIIRRYDRRTLVVFNELYANFYGWWNAELQEPTYYNVIVDYHLYDGIGWETLESESQHLSNAEAYGTLIDSYSFAHPVLVGEWSMSTGPTPDQKFVDACVAAFHRSVGWYLWNFKIESELENEYVAWDVLNQLQLEEGLRPISLDSLSR